MRYVTKITLVLILFATWIGCGFLLLTGNLGRYILRSIGEISVFPYPADHVLSLTLPRTLIPIVVISSIAICIVEFTVKSERVRFLVQVLYMILWLLAMTYATWAHSVFADWCSRHTIS
jgi:hypothetical protein